MKDSKDEEGGVGRRPDGSFGGFAERDKGLFCYLLNRAWPHRGRPFHRIPVSDAAEFLGCGVGGVGEAAARLAAIGIGTWGGGPLLAPGATRIEDGTLTFGFGAAARALVAASAGEA